MKFSGTNSEKSNLAEMIRKDIIDELEAINQYDLHYRMTDDPVAKKVFADIRDEEKVHVGELFTLLAYIEPEDAKFLAKGEEEVKEFIN